ncbi:MFS transporter [Cohnella thailandensis]|uniref:MFS transporter n=1 Tax=Cohnella thailandensis TaxID=557557 RepID=A0A841T8S9_9BACL|nr:MFS transporter [Cohnella thailandensis]MBB6637591.1 MFS transporter [Cohnella thailandensis]MBP1974233.1 putative MFS family arabinose efflux permease [Cohnella thailandensis]
MSKFPALFFLIMFMIGTDTFLVSPLLPTLQAEFGVSTDSAGWMLSAYALGSAVFALIAGPLSDGWNRRVVLLCGLTAFSVCTFLCGLATDFWTMCLFRLLAGISAAFTAPQVWASIPSVLPPQRIARTMGLAFSGLAASQAFGVPIGSWLASGGWSVPFWTIGCASLLLAVFAYFALPSMPPMPSPSSSAGASTGLGAILRRYVPLARSGKARAGFLAYLLIHLGSGAAFAFSGKWLAEDFGLTVGEIGTAVIFLGLGNLLGSAISSSASRKLGAARTVAAAMLGAAALYALLPQLSPVSAATAVYFAICTLLGIVFPLVMGALTSLNASLRGTISSLANATMNGANTLGAWLAGLMFVHLGGYSAIGLFAAVCLAASLATFLAGGLFARESSRAASAGRPASN